MILNITNYGADQATDNHAAIATAIQAAQSGDTVLIPPGKWPVSDVHDSQYNTQVYVALKSGITLQVDGELRANPTSSPAYAVVSTHGVQDVSIVGSGYIIGERQQHTGTGGEWGYGVSIRDGVDVNVSAHITQTWGDGILIDGNSSKISVSRSGITYARRNGISVANVNGLWIENNNISNIGGTAPGIGIDFEADFAAETIQNVTVQYNSFSNTSGANISVGSVAGTYKGFTINNNNHDFKTQPIWVGGQGGDLGTPWYAVAYRLAAGSWKLYPTRWSKP